jgi:type IV secretory pathway VirB10-like protein
VKLSMGAGRLSAKDGRPPPIVMVGTLAVAGLVALAGLWVLFGRDEAHAVPSMSAEGEKLVARGTARSTEMRISAAKLQQKAVGDGYEFDSDGGLLGASADESDLPRNRTLAQTAPPAPTSELSREIVGVRHRPERSVEGDGMIGQGGGMRARSGGGVSRQVDRGLLTQSMLAYSTVRSAAWAERRPEGDRKEGSPGTTRAAAGGTRALEEHQSDERMLSMMEGLQERMLAGKEEAPGGGGSAEVGTGRSTTTLYPAASSPQGFARGAVGDMRIISGPATIVRQGKFLDCVLVNELRVDLAESPVIAMVSRSFLSSDGNYVLVPAGAKLLGTAGTVQSLQQVRVYIKFDRVLFPDQRSAYFPVKQVGAVDGMGAVGIPGDVDRHLLLQFGAAVALGMLDGLAAAVQTPPTGGDPRARDLVMSRTSSNFSAVVAGALQRYANVVPTVTVNAGEKMKVFFADDVRMSPYMRSSDLSWMR